MFVQGDHLTCITACSLFCATEDLIAHRSPSQQTLEALVINGHYSHYFEYISSVMVVGQSCPLE